MTSSASRVTEDDDSSPPSGRNPAYGPRTEGARLDAMLILDVLRATRAWVDESKKAAPTRPVRELIWSVWEKPRLRHYADEHRLAFHRSKYPSWVPWSPLARAIHADDPQARLVFEHLTPARVIVRDLIERVPATPAGLIKVLNARLGYAVIAPEDNRKIMEAGLAWKLVDGDPDPWARYRAVGLDPATFAPIATVTEY